MINVQQLSISFEKKQILHNLNLSFERGGFYAIMGPNGCGKTTLLRSIAGLLKPTLGEVLIQNTPVSHYSANELARNLSIVRQQMPTDFEFSAFETVMMGRNPYQHRLQNPSQSDHLIVEQCMKQTNTWHLKDSMPSQMSGGEFQRVMIARALAQQTPIMLLDEPTSNLDIAHQFEVMQLLTHINLSQGKTILIVVHDLNLAYNYCPQLLLLNHGSVAFQGPTKQGLAPHLISQVFGVDAQITPQGIHLFSNHSQTPL